MEKKKTINEKILDKLDGNLCPRCKENKLDKVEIRNALSRRDNKTFICSDCGIGEAMFDFSRSQGKVSEEEIKQEKNWLK